MSILHRRRRVKARLRAWENEGEIVSYDAQLRAKSLTSTATRAPKKKARKKAKRRPAAK